MMENSLYITVFWYYNIINMSNVWKKTSILIPWVDTSVWKTFQFNFRTNGIYRFGTNTFTKSLGLIISITRNYVLFKRNPTRLGIHS